MQQISPTTVQRDGRKDYYTRYARDYREFPLEAVSVNEFLAESNRQRGRGTPSGPPAPMSNKTSYREVYNSGAAFQASRSAKPDPDLLFSVTQEVPTRTRVFGYGDSATPSSTKDHFGKSNGPPKMREPYIAKGNFDVGDGRPDFWRTDYRRAHGSSEAGLRNTQAVRGSHIERHFNTLPACLWFMNKSPSTPNLHGNR